MIDEKKMELLKKLQALAERGERGERSAAKRQLERLMNKYNIQETDLTDEIVSMHWFKTRGKYEKQLLAQLVDKIARGRTTYRHTYGPGQRTETGVECTKAEALQIQIELEFYARQFEKEVNLFFRAFIQKHEIYNDEPPAEHQRAAPLSMAEIRRMSAMINGMEDATMRKMIAD